MQRGYYTCTTSNVKENCLFMTIAASHIAFLYFFQNFWLCNWFLYYILHSDSVCSFGFILTPAMTWLRFRWNNRMHWNPFIVMSAEKTFSRSNNLELHMVAHTGFKLFPLSQCGKCFTTSSSQKRHECTHMKDKSD